MGKRKTATPLGTAGELANLVGDNARHFRRQRGLTLEATAARAQYDFGNLSKLERGILPYSQPVLERLAGALNIKVRDFFLNRAERALLTLWDTMGQAERAVLERVLSQHRAGGAPLAELLPPGPKERPTRSATRLPTSFASPGLQAIGRLRDRPVLEQKKA